MMLISIYFRYKVVQIVCQYHKMLVLNVFLSLSPLLPFHFGRVVFQYGRMNVADIRKITSGQPYHFENAPFRFGKDRIVLFLARNLFLTDYKSLTK